MLASEAYVRKLKRKTLEFLKLYFSLCNQGETFYDFKLIFNNDQCEIKRKVATIYAPRIQNGVIIMGKI
jgi:hypothetical protein